MAAGLEPVVGLGLKGQQVKFVLLGILHVGGVALVKDTGIGAVLGGVPALGGYVHRLLDLLLLTILVHHRGLDLLGLDIVAQLLLHLLAEPLQHTAAVILKVFVQGGIGRRQRHVALSHELVAGEDAGDGRRAQQNGGGIQPDVLEAGVGVDLHTVAAGVLLGVGLSGLGNAGILGALNPFDVVLGLLCHLEGLGSGLAGHDGAHHHADHAGGNQDFRALLLKLEPHLVEGQAHRFHDLVGFHCQISSLENDLAMDL